MSTSQTAGLSTLEESNTTLASETLLRSLFFYQVALSLWKFYYPIILLLGTFGNVMSIVIMRRMTSKESTVNLFFIAIAVGDLLVLYTGTVFKWISIAFAVNIIDGWPALYYPVFCTYLSSGGFVSWMLVCVTLQRALSVVWPHHINRISTRRRVVIVIISIAAFQVILYSHHLYCIYVALHTNITGSQCIGMESFNYVWFLDHVFIYIAMFVSSVFPFTCLVVGNSVLVFTLVRSVRQASKTMTTGSSQLNLQRKKDTSFVTITIVVVSTTFIVLTLPVYVYASLYRFKDQTKFSIQEKARQFLFYTVGSLMTDTNSATNFYLYCLTGRRFRDEFIKILSCGKKAL